MDTRDNFIKEFDELMEIPRDYSLEQWQYVYKKVVFSIGMRILKEFRKDVFGPDPFNGGGTTKSPNKGGNPVQAGPGPGPGWHPSVVVGILSGVLQLVPTKPKKKHKP
jgi:hypothetical protein